MVRNRERCRQRIGGRPDPTRMIAASVTVSGHMLEVDLAGINGLTVPLLFTSVKPRLTANGNRLDGGSVGVGCGWYY